jgi:hypothetical protein
MAGNGDKNAVKKYSVLCCLFIVLSYNAYSQGSNKNMLKTGLVKPISYSVTSVGSQDVTDQINYIENMRFSANTDGLYIIDLRHKETNKSEYVFFKISTSQSDENFYNGQLTNIFFEDTNAMCYIDDSATGTISIDFKSNVAKAEILFHFYNSAYNICVVWENEKIIVKNDEKKPKQYKTKKKKRFGFK